MTTDLLSLNPFNRLADLMRPLTPGRSPLPDGRVVNLALGDPRTPVPDFALEAMKKAEAGWSRYAGTRPPEFPAAAAEWLTRRFDLPVGFLDPLRHVTAVGGSREGLFHACLAAMSAKRHAMAAAGRSETPLILLPDPGYHAYAGAAVAATGEPYYVSVTAESGHLPQLAELPAEVLDRAALAFLCTPANPQGVVAPPELLERSLRLARKHGFVLVVDECYSELYEGETPPTGALTVAHQMGGGLQNLLVSNSLSKRSGAPGMRLGLLAGDSDMIRSIEGHLRFGGSGPGLPLLAAGAALWREEKHVARNRAYYRANTAMAERIFGNGFGWRRPGGGFFLWMDIRPGRFEEGESAAAALYSQAGIQVLPGAYMSLAQRPMEDNPGRPYIRVSLAEPPEILEPLLTRMAEILL